MANSLESTLKAIKPLDNTAMVAAQQRQNSLTKPHGSLGRLEELSIQIAGITGKVIPELEHKAIITMAADHGVVAEGVTLYPQEVTRQMVQNFLAFRWSSLMEQILAVLLLWLMFTAMAI